MSTREFDLFELIKTYSADTMTTIGDRVLNISLPKIGEKSLFTKDLEDALLRGKIDFVVHSLKDLPTSLPEGMAIGAVLEREDPRDVLVLNQKYQGKTLKSLPEGSIIGTSSLRRAAQLARLYPNVAVCDIRGNLNTRLAKLDADTSKFAGIILAHAGLVRMGWESRISQVLENDDLMYAVGQGALAVECRSDDKEILEMLEKLCCKATQSQILAERSFLRTLGGGCSAPVAVSCSLKSSHDQNVGKLTLRGAVWSLDGKTEIQDEVSCEIPWRTVDEVDAVPAKKAKTIEIETRRKSPDIVDDSKATLGVDSQNLDIEAIINIHGDAFKKCPYSMEHQKQSDNREGCPINIPIGQDVMGDCPYFDISQKVDLAEKFGPEQVPPAAGSSKCPFSGTKVNVEKAPVNKCPFLAQQIKLIDCDAHSENAHEDKEIILSNSRTSVPLFCGLFCHQSFNEDVLRKSENLGNQLAHILMANGAQEVMKKAQNEIHEKA